MKRWPAAFAAAVTLSALAAAGAVEAQAAEPLPQHAVQDPHYGDALFQFFQDRYFSALTGLMVSQHFERVQRHADEAEVLRGGLLLSYGLHREAGEVFARLLQQGASPSVRDRAWFYLAKIRYQRGLLAEAQEAIAKVQGPLPGGLEDEHRLLQSDILLAQGEYASAATALAGMTSSPDAGRYARFNLGVALIRSGDSAGGSRWLQELGIAPADNEEQRSVRDKANVALGFVALKDEHPAQARVALERVRLKGPQANKALLGFGWAAAAMKNPQDALVPWTELVQREPNDAAALEARIALPYAYAELGALGQALQHYQAAIAWFERESSALDESMAAIRSGKLVEALMQRNPGEEMGWFWRLEALPEMPHAGHLAPVLAEHRFQEAFKNYRDLRFLAANLQRWSEDIAVFGDMLATRRQAFADKLPKVLAASRDTGRSALQQRRDALAQELQRAETQADGVAFADPNERALMKRLADVQTLLTKAGDEPEMAQAKERARRISGALSWQLAQGYPARDWQARKALAGLEAGVEKATQQEAELARAEREQPQRFEAFGVRISELDKRLHAMMPRVAALSGEQQQVVQAIAVEALDQQKQRLAAYTLQARFAVAQLYDRAQQAEGGEHAPQR